MVREYKVIFLTFYFQAQDSTRKMSEVQQSESYLRSRVEELEVTENMLRETLHQADLILAQRERKLRDQVCVKTLCVQYWVCWVLLLEK